VHQVEVASIIWKMAKRSKHLDANSQFGFDLPKLLSIFAMAIALASFKSPATLETILSLLIGAGAF